MPSIHPMAIVDQNAKIADDVKIGPFCTVGPNVEIGAGTILVSHCSIIGYTTIGENNKISPFVSLGSPPQDLEWDEARSYLKIGAGNTFREGFTANPGTKPETSTIIGNDCFFMGNSHIAHNCKIGNNVIMVNGALIGGYAELGDKCVMSGNIAVHQFCKVGRLAMIGGGTAISKDLPPFMMCFSKTNTVSGINIIGMKRNGFSKETIRAIKNVYKLFFRDQLLPKQATEQVLADKSLTEIPEVQEFLDFVANSKRGILSSHVAYLNREGQE
jgi:UDP-N-acetylglucosamine acyltransferase